MAHSWTRGYSGAAERRRRRECSRGDDGKLSGDSWQEATEEAEGVQCILSAMMVDSHLDMKENVQMPWSNLKPYKAHRLGGL